MKKSLFVMICVGIIFAFPVFAADIVDLSAPEYSGVPKNLFPYDRTLYEYNAQGQLVKKTVLYDKEMKVTNTYTFEYNSQGLLVKENKYKAGKLDDYILYEYDAQKRMIKEIEYGAKSKLKEFKTYTYQDNGRTVVRKNMDETGKICDKIVVERYDAAGHLLEKAVYKD